MKNSKKSRSIDLARTSGVSPPSRDWQNYVYGARGMAEQCRFVLDIRKPGADLEALAQAVRVRARNYFRSSYNRESAFFGMQTMIDVELENLAAGKSVPNCTPSKPSPDCLWHCDQAVA